MTVSWQIIGYLGALSWPFLIMSILTLAILAERATALVVVSCGQWQQTLCSRNKNELNALCVLTESQQLQQYKQLLGKWAKKHSLLARGITVLLACHQQDKHIREEIVSLWLKESYQKLTANLQILNIIGMICPLLGLLGTVLGLITMFADLAEHHQAVTPALLADGLGQAMYTTAAGLIIAVPAFLGTYLYRLWADKLIDTAEYVLNRINLNISGALFSSHSKHIL